jgi:hypothetical protein
MAHQWFKTKYKEYAYYGAGCYEEEHTLYVHINESCDITSFYNEKGECVLSYEDTLDNNIFDAMNKLVFPYKKGWFGELLDDVENLDDKDRELFKNK